MTAYHQPPHTLDELLDRRGSPHPSCDVTMMNRTRMRRYQLWSDAPGSFIGDVSFNRCHHRRKRVVGVFHATMLADEFAREIRDLLTDGWVTVRQRSTVSERLDFNR